MAKTSWDIIMTIKIKASDEFLRIDHMFKKDEKNAMGQLTALIPYGIEEVSSAEFNEEDSSWMFQVVGDKNKIAYYVNLTNPQESEFGNDIEIDGKSANRIMADKEKNYLNESATRWQKLAGILK
jgi:hypothetical protein